MHVPLNWPYTPLIDDYGIQALVIAITQLLAEMFPCKDFRGVLVKSICSCNESTIVGKRIASLLLFQIAFPIYAQPMLQFSMILLGILGRSTRDSCKTVKWEALNALSLWSSHSSIHNKELANQHKLIIPVSERRYPFLHPDSS